MREGEREGLLPREIGGEAVGVGTGVPPCGTGGLTGHELGVKRQLKESVHLVIGLLDEDWIHAVVDHLEEAVG